MKRNKFIAWLLVLSVFFSMLTSGMNPAYAEETANTGNDGVNMSSAKTESVRENVYLTPAKPAIDMTGFTTQVSVNAADDTINAAREHLAKSLAYIKKNVPNPKVGTGSGEWSVISLARGNYLVEESYYDIYYNNVVNELKSKQGVLSKNTDYARVILGLTSVGKGVADVGGYNLLAKLSDYNDVLKQGLNGPIWALIALDSKNYQLPLIDGVPVQTIKDKLIDYIINAEYQKGTTSAGGWSLGGKPDPDITAMTIQAFTPYYKTNEQVKAAVDRGIKWLSETQNSVGSYNALGNPNSQSVAQVVVALAGLDIDPLTDDRFIKNGKSALEGLLSFAIPDGGFMNTKPTGTNAPKLDAMSTDQGTYALVAYDRFLKKKNRLYDMTDLQLETPSTPPSTDPTPPSAPDPTPPSTPETPPVPQPVTYANLLVDKLAIGKGFVVAADKLELQSSDTAWSLLKRELDNRGISYDYSWYTGFNSVHLKSIDGDGEFDHGIDSGWMYMVNGGFPDSGASEYVLKEGDTVQWQYVTSYENPLSVIEIAALPNGERPEVAIPLNDRNYVIPIKSEDSTKFVKIGIPEDKKAKVHLQLPTNINLPEIEAVKGNVTLTIAKNTKKQSGSLAEVELITSLDPSQDVLRDQVKGIVPQGKQLDKILQAFSMGGLEKVEFSEFVTLAFKGLAGNDAIYMQGGSVSAISKYTSDEQGLQSGKAEYAYDSGKDLIVKTKHFTDFVAYASSAVASPPTDNIPVSAPVERATLSVDKSTIGKGYVVAPKSVELQAGDTAWSVLQRELDNRGISYDYEWYEVFDSIYVKSIDGDGEFDHGAGSGWNYNVNGVYPSHGASLHTLQNGDVVQWRYTTNLGEDLGQSPSDLGVIPTGQSNPPTVIEVPKDIQSDYTVSITKEQRKNGDVIIKIPSVKSKIYLNLEEVKDNIPSITVTKGDISLVIDTGSRLLTENPQIELFTVLDPQDAKVQELIKGSLNESDKLEHVYQAFQMGDTGNSVVFSQPLTFIITDGKGRLPGYIEEQKFTPIVVYETEDKGKQATQSKEKKTYAFVKDNNLTLKTNYFTDFVLYKVSKAGTETEEAAETTETSLDLNKLYADAAAVSDWAYKSIYTATQKRFIQGSEGKLYPKSDVTRAEFTKMLVSVLGIQPTADKAVGFADVAKEDWFSPYVNAAYQAGIVTGYSDGFHPNETITREQMAVIVRRALGVQPAKLAAILKDWNEVSEWAQSDVESVVAFELMVGNGNQFDPRSTVTREMAVVVAMRAYDNKNTPKPNNDAPVQAGSKDVSKQIEETAAYMQKTITNPVVSSIGGEWTVFGLARSGVQVPDEYYAKYYANVENTLKEKSGKLHHVKYTEYDRVILALTAIGKSVDNVAGYNLRESLADFDTLIKQGINGPIFALIALDSKHYEIPSVKDVKTQTTKERLIDFILQREIAGGGWALGDSSTESDPDVTAMAIQGLTPYYEANQQVKAAVDRAVAWLSGAQKTDGGYASGGSVNVESVAQVVTALSGLGVNAYTDARFIKNGQSALDALLSYSASGGGFYHVKSNGADNGGAKPGVVDPMATDQAMYALVAYDRFIKNLSRLYDLTDVK